jgi:hypothetical protein
MSDNWGYIAAAWIIVFGGLGGYAVRTILRGRSLSRQVPPEKRRWS